MTKRKRRRHPRVFISYSHDEQPVEHMDRVLKLADQLIIDGIDCVLDQYEEAPPEGWPMWMDREIRGADFVLMVCTETYYRRVSGQEEPGKGRGVKWEGRLIFQHFYKSDGWNKKFIPILFSYCKAEHIPDPFQSDTYYMVDDNEQYEKLYARLTGRKYTSKPKPGAIREVKRKTRKTDFFAGSTRKGHQKVSHIEEITNQLRAKGREQKAHICHNDDEAERDCKVQKHSVGLTFEVKDFDSETNKTLEFLDTLLTIELKSDELGSSKSYKRAKYKLDEPVRKFFRILEVVAEEYFRGWKKEDDEELLKRLIKKITKNLPVLKPARENALSMLEDLSIFVRALACYKLQRNVGTSEGQHQYFDSYDNTMRIKSSAATVRGSILSYLQSYLNENVELIDESVDGFSHPFKESPSPPPPPNPKPCVPIREVLSPRKPKAGSEQEEKSK